MAISRVVAPDPSRWPIKAMSTVANISRRTFPPTTFSTLLTMRSNTPASFITPKNRTAKINRIAVVETLETPALMYSLISVGLKPTAKPTRIGKRMNTTAGVLLPHSRRATIRIIRAKPATPSNDITLLPFKGSPRESSYVHQKPRFVLMPRL